MINEKSMKLAGWLSVVAAITIIPIMLVGFLSGLNGMSNTFYNYASSILNAGYTGLFIYIYILLRRLLNDLANFHKTDAYITGFIWINIIIAVAGLVATPFPGLIGLHSIVTTVLLIPLGIIYVVFGVKLLGCSHPLFGYLKPLAYSIILSGIFTAIFFMAILAVIPIVISNIIMALIFFKACKKHDDSIATAQAT